jgi:hypothetical protein|tara:strand:+ start:714 stop:881 length:168 start_codon:yes stop_codon:yes gene_type:complete
MYERDDYLAIPMDEIHKMKPAVSGNTVFNDLGNQLPHGTYYIVKIVETQSHQFVY